MGSSEENEALVRRFYEELINRRDLGAVNGRGGTAVEFTTDHRDVRLRQRQISTRSWPSDPWQGSRATAEPSICVSSGRGFVSLGHGYASRR